jgi:hypothetical protein
MLSSNYCRIHFFVSLCIIYVLCISKDGTYIFCSFPFSSFLNSSIYQSAFVFLPLYCIPSFPYLCFFVPSSLLFYLPITFSLIIFFLCTIFHFHFPLFPSYTFYFIPSALLQFFITCWMTNHSMPLNKATRCYICITPVCIHAIFVGVA